MGGICCGLLGEHTADDTTERPYKHLPCLQYNALEPFQNSMKELHTYVLTFPTSPARSRNNRYFTEEVSPPQQLESMSCFSELYHPAKSSGKDQNHFYLIGMDHRPTALRNGQPCGPLPMCRTGLSCLYSHGGLSEQQFFNFMATTIDSHTTDPTSGKNQIYEAKVCNWDGSAPYQAFYRDCYKNMQENNFYVQFWVEAHLREDTVVLGEDVMPWVKASNITLLEHWYSGTYSKYSKSLPYSPASFYEMGSSLRKLLGIESYENGRVRGKQLQSGASLVIAHSGIKFKHQLPRNIGATNALWPLAVREFAYKEGKDCPGKIGHFIGHMEVQEVPVSGLEALVQLAKKGIPRMPDRAGTSKFCGVTMEPYTSGVRTWKQAHFAPSLEGDGPFAATDLESNTGFAPIMKYADDSQQQSINELKEWVTGHAVDYVRRYEETMNPGPPGDAYATTLSVSYEQGRMSTDLSATTVPHRKIAASVELELRKERVYVVQIEFPLGEFGYYQRFWKDATDQDGKLVHVTYGSAVVFPASLVQEVGMISHIDGSPKLCLRVVVAAGKVSQEAASKLLDAKAREYPHILHTVAEEKAKMGDGDYEMRLHVIRARNCVEKPKELPAFSRFKQGHDYKHLHEGNFV